MKTYSAKHDPASRKWILVDAKDEILGRLASRIALRLRGKHLPTFTPHVDTGDFVVVINAEKVRVTGRKMQQKMYYRHTGYMGGIRERNLRKMMQEKPEEVLRLAVRGMLPKNRLGRKMLKKLKIYTGEKHPHEAQKPELVELS